MMLFGFIYIIQSICFSYCSIYSSLSIQHFILKDYRNILSFNVSTHETSLLTFCLLFADSPASPSQFVPSQYLSSFDKLNLLSNSHLMVEDDYHILIYNQSLHLSSRTVHSRILGIYAKFHEPCR